MRSLLPVLGAAALALALPGAARAQGFDGSQSVDGYSGLVVGSSRVIGLGGAYVGVAEGIGGTPVNPAAAAHRRRDLRGVWDLDGTISASALDTDQDLDNDGGNEVGLAGFAHLELGGSVQRERVGLVALARAWLSRGPGSAQGSVGIQTGDVILAGGYSGWNDALVLGVSLTAASGAVIQYRFDGKEQRRLTYSDQAFAAGALWRPRGRPFRLGASYFSGGRARPEQDASADFAGLAPRSIDFPWVLAVGGSLWLGPNAHLYNEPALHELAVHPEAIRDGVAYDPEAVQPVLLAAQLDVVGPTPGAITVASALVPGATARPSGEHASIVPRLGVEWEALRRSLRLRAGSYLEPARTGGTSRLHATFGAETRVPFWPWDLQLGIGGDVADRFANVGLTLGFWGERGPVEPVRAGAGE